MKLIGNCFFSDTCSKPAYQTYQYRPYCDKHLKEVKARQQDKQNPAFLPKQVKLQACKHT